MSLISVSAVLGPLLVCAAAALASRRGGPLRGRLRRVAVAMGVMTLAFVVFHVEWAHTGRPQFPSVGEPLFVTGYVLLIAAWWPRRRRRSRAASGSGSELLDATLVVVGPAAVVAAVVVDPLLDGYPAGRSLLLLVYPLVDLLLLTCLFHAALRGLLSRGQAVAWLLGTCSLVFGDCLFFLGLGGDSVTTGLSPVGFYTAAFAAFAVAVWLRAPRDGGGPLLPLAEHTPPVARRRLVLVSVSSCLPATALVLEGAVGGGIDWTVLGAGSLLTAVLAALRLHWALSTSHDHARALDQLARYDELTGLPNRRELTHALHAAVAEPGAQVVVAVLDLDHFKQVNDAGGHAAGDRLLRQVARAWQLQLAPVARLHRWGGEEFVALFPDATPQEALAALEAARTATPAPCTASVGVAVRQPGEPVAQLLVRADENLYRAKADGRDRVRGDAGSTAGTAGVAARG